MKNILLLIPTLIASTLLSVCQDSLKTSFNFNYHRDFSDSFGGGNSLSGELIFSKSWLGAGIGYGYFQSHILVTYEITIEEDSQTYTIPFDEIANMKTGSFFGLIKPIKKEWFHLDILLGVAYAKSKYLCFKSLSYTYNLNDKYLTSIERDYQMVNRKHFGYQVGANLSFYPFKKGIGVQLSSRVQDLSHGGTFFLIGGGLVFNL